MLRFVTSSFEDTQVSAQSKVKRRQRFVHVVKPCCWNGWFSVCATHSLSAIAANQIQRGISLRLHSFVCIASHDAIPSFNTLFGLHVFLILCSPCVHCFCCKQKKDLQHVQAETWLCYRYVCFSCVGAENLAGCLCPILFFTHLARWCVESLAEQHIKKRKEMSHYVEDYCKRSQSIPFCTIVCLFVCASTDAKKTT